MKIDRRRNEQKVTLIEDDTEIPSNHQCTDLIGIRTNGDEAPSYIQYFIARTLSAINIIDTVKEKMYCLQVDQNYRYKFRKTVCIPRSIPYVNGVVRDMIQYQVLYVSESTHMSGRNLSDPGDSDGGRSRSNSLQEESKVSISQKLSALSESKTNSQLLDSQTS